MDGLRMSELDFLQWALIILLFASNFIVWVELRAMQKSTHQVQFINTPKGEFEKFNKELEDKLSKELYENIN